MKKSILPLLGGLALCVAIFIPSPSWAGPARNATDDPIFENYGNSWRALQVSCSTSTAVIISTSANNSNLGIYEWRYREVVNTSNAILTLYPSSTNAVYTSTYSVVLGTGTSGLGDIYQTHNQGNIYGIWQSGVSCTGGAGGHEDYFSGVFP